MQLPLLPTFFIEPPKPDNFVPNFSTNLKVIQIRVQSAIHLWSKTLIISDQLHLPNPKFRQQQNPPQSYNRRETQLINTHFPQNFPPVSNTIVKPPPWILPQQLSSPQLPVIPSSIAQQLNEPPTTIHSKAESIPFKPSCFSVPPHQHVPPKFNIALNLWRFPQIMWQTMQPFSTNFNQFYP